MGGWRSDQRSQWPHRFVIVFLFKTNLEGVKTLQNITILISITFKYKHLYEKIIKMFVLFIFKKEKYCGKP